VDEHSDLVLVRWRQCDSAGQNCTDITGGTSSSYVISADDVGHVLRAVVTASNADGPTSVASAATSSVAALVTVAAPIRPLRRSRARHITARTWKR